MFDGKISICAMDTDSFFLHVENIDVENKLLPRMVQDKLLDSSNFSRSHPLFSDELKAKLGCIKDEGAGQPFKEWIFLRPKCYSLLYGKNASVSKAKGVQQSVVKKELSFDDYKVAFEECVERYNDQRRIGSKLHAVSTMYFNKRSLSFFDDKKAWINSNVSYSFGHYKLNIERPKSSIKRSIITPTLLCPAAKSPR